MRRGKAKAPKEPKAKEKQPGGMYILTQKYDKPRNLIPCIEKDPFFYRNIIFFRPRAFNGSKKKKERRDSKNHVPNV